MAIWLDSEEGVRAEREFWRRNFPPKTPLEEEAARLADEAVAVLAAVRCSLCAAGFAAFDGQHRVYNNGRRQRDVRCPAADSPATEDAPAAPDDASRKEPAAR